MGIQRPFVVMAQVMAAFQQSDSVAPNEYLILNNYYSNYHHPSVLPVASTKQDEGDQHRGTFEAAVITTRDPDRSEYFAENRMREVHFGAE